MNNKIKKIFIVFLLASLMVPSIFSQSISLSIIDGDKNSFNIYNEVGKKISLEEDDIVVNSKVIIKTDNKDVEFSYGYGTFTLKSNSILVANPFDKNPTLYLVDGQINLTTQSSFILDYVITTPVSKYQFSSPAKVSIISNENLEYGVFFEGQGTSYNALSGETTFLGSLQMIDMAFSNNFTLDVPVEYSLDTDVNNPILIDTIKQTYQAKEKEIFAENKKVSETIRSKALNTPYLFDVNPVQKSKSFDKYTSINLVVTGNGQGNISALNLPAFSGIIKSAKENDENVLLIDGGNTLNGSAFVNFDKGKTAAQVLDLVGYDVFVPGAMDLSYGPEHLAKLDKQVKTSFISSNALNNDLFLYFKPFGLYLFDDFKIVVLGLSNPSDITKQMDLDLTNQIIVENAQEAINQAKEVADYVIVVSNINYKNFDSSYILNNIKGIDLLIDSNNSNAMLMNVSGVPVINTGVGYSEIHNYTIRVKGEDVISTRHAKVYSSTLAEADNKLASSLNVDSYKKDTALLAFLNTVKVPKDLSLFLTEPSFADVTVEVKDKPFAPSAVEVKSTQVFVKEIPLPPTLLDVSTTEAVVKEIPVAPTIVDLKTTPATPSIIDVKVAPFIEEVIASPTFVDVKVTPLFEEVVDSPVIIKEPIVKLSPPTFKEVPYSIKEESILEQPITTVEQPVEEAVIKTEPQKVSIYSGEDSKVKTHIGVDATLKADLDILDSTFSNFDFLGNLTLLPYIYRGGNSLGLRLNGNTDDFASFKTNLSPLPTSLSQTSAYILDFIDHVSIANASDSVNLNANRNTFQSLTQSAIAYDTLGGGVLHGAGIVDFGKVQLKGFLSDLDIAKPFKGTPEKVNASLAVVLQPVDSVDISLGTLAIGHKTELDLYPTFNFRLIPLNNKDIQLNVNIGATLYLQATPLDFKTILDTNNPRLVPNYLANVSFDVNTETLMLSLGANYLATEDSSKFTTNMIHKNIVNNSDDIFTPVSSNTLTAVGQFGYNNAKVDLSAKYSLPIDLSPSLTFKQRLGNDLIDIDLGLKFNNLTIGGFYLHNNFGKNTVNLVKNITDLSTIKSFLVNNNTEYGGYVKYDFNGLALKGALVMPSSTAPIALQVSLNYKLDFAF